MSWAATTRQSGWPLRRRTTETETKAQISSPLRRTKRFSRE
jgi:hypothetical protein